MDSRHKLVLEPRCRLALALCLALCVLVAAPEAPNQSSRLASAQSTRIYLPLLGAEHQHYAKPVTSIGGPLRAVVSHGDLLIVSLGHALQIHRAESGDRFQEIGRLPGRFVWMHAQGDRLIAQELRSHESEANASSDLPSTLTIIDISDPRSPTRIAQHVGAAGAPIWVGKGWLLQKEMILGPTYVVWQWDGDARLERLGEIATKGIRLTGFARSGDSLFLAQYCCDSIRGQFGRPSETRVYRVDASLQVRELALLSGREWRLLAVEGDLIVLAGKEMLVLELGDPRGPSERYRGEILQDRLLDAVWRGPGAELILQSSTFDDGKPTRHLHRLDLRSPAAPRTQPILSVDGDPISAGRLLIGFLRKTESELTIQRTDSRSGDGLILEAARSIPVVELPRLPRWQPYLPWLEKRGERLLHLTGSQLSIIAMDHSGPVPRGRLQQRVELGFEPFTAAAIDDRLYLSLNGQHRGSAEHHRPAQIKIWDVSEGTAPRSLGSLDLPREYDVRLMTDPERRLLFSAEFNRYPADVGGLRILDASEPDAPVTIGYIPGDILAAAVEGMHLYIVEERGRLNDTSTWLQRYDISDPARPLPDGDALMLEPGEHGIFGLYSRISAIDGHLYLDGGTVFRFLEGGPPLRLRRKPDQQSRLPVPERCSGPSAQLFTRSSFSRNHFELVEPSDSGLVHPLLRLDASDQVNGCISDGRWIYALGMNGIQIFELPD